MFNDSKLDSPAFYKLWSLMLDESKLDPAYTKSCITAISDIFKKSNAKASEKEKFIELCVNYVKKNTSVPQALVLFLSICVTISANGLNYFLKDSAVDELVAKWNKNAGLVEIVIKNLENYVTKFKAFYNSSGFPESRRLNYQNYVSFTCLNA